MVGMTHQDKQLCTIWTSLRGPKNQGACSRTGRATMTPFYTAPPGQNSETSRGTPSQHARLAAGADGGRPYVRASGTPANRRHLQTGSADTAAPQPGSRAWEMQEPQFPCPAAPAPPSCSPSSPVPQPHFPQPRRARVPGLWGPGGFTRTAGDSAPGHGAGRGRGAL